ncbi:hypothetical protein Taro_021828 [Colocasia esculenta]|uniref:Uncharacterized protein n=1 Tax=Colocasia esculenta TaxID=4460 RepID=A0A843V044_COLES|nr:hypothetical protein [Colocasia esculenta]
MVLSQGEPEYDASPECFALADLWLHAGSSLEGSSKILARACSAFCHPEHKITKHNTQNVIDLVKCVLSIFWHQKKNLPSYNMSEKKYVT